MVPTTSAPEIFVPPVNTKSPRPDAGIPIAGLELVHDTVDPAMFAGNGILIEVPGQKAASACAETCGIGLTVAFTANGIPLQPAA